MDKEIKKALIDGIWFASILIASGYVMYNIIKNISNIYDLVVEAFA